MSVSIYKIKKWYKMLTGQSISHVNQGTGTCYSKTVVSGYYNDLTEKVTKDAFLKKPCKKYWNEDLVMTIRTIINKFRGVMDVPSLVKKGLTIGENVFINFGCIIDESFCWLIKIGDNVTLAPNVHILAHDASTKKAIGFTKRGGNHW